MGLVDHHHPALGPDLAGGLQGGAHFGGVVAVVVHQQGDTAWQPELAHLGKTAPDAGEACQAPLYGAIVQALVAGHRDGRRGIEGIVGSRHIEIDVQWCRGRAL